MSTQSELVDQIRREADSLGFAACGFAPAVAPGETLDRFRQWLDAGFAGEMHYLGDRWEAYTDPNRVLDGVRSIVILAAPYAAVQPKAAAPGTGRVSRYAWGDDYHDVLHDRLKQLVARLRPAAPRARWRGVVDTAPLLEREFARLAGLGWIGKHTLALDRQLGSWFFLAAVLTDLNLEVEATAAVDSCGSCTACLDACPTDAFVAPYQLDARKCISYLTIEHRGSIPESLRAGVGDWLFGCDVCQDVCPWNRRAPAAAAPEFTPRDDRNPLDATELLTIDDAEFRRRFRGTPLMRSKRRGLLRNAAIVLGNQPPSAAARRALVAGLHDVEPLVRGAAAWALGRHGDSESREALRARKSIEDDADVVAEISAALTRVEESAR